MNFVVYSTNLCRVILVGLLLLFIADIHYAAY